MSDELAEAKQLIKTLQGQVQSLQYTKNHDYKFLIEENKKMTQELADVKADNKNFKQKINDMSDNLRDANF